MRAALIVLLLAATAHAQAPEPDAATLARAKEYLKIGKEAMEGKQYEVAIAAFEQTYQLTPKPTAAYALALAYQGQWGQDADPVKLKRAVLLFEEVLAQPDDDTRPKHPKTKEYLEVLRPALDAIEAKAAAEGGGPIADIKAAPVTALILSSKVKGTMLRFDDEVAVAAPIVKQTTPGPHRVAAYADGYYTTSQDVLAVEGQSLPFDLLLEERPAALTVRSEDGARVLVDGFAVGYVNQELSVAAGMHRIDVTAPGRHAWSQLLELSRGETVEVEAPLRRTAKRRAVKYVVAGGIALVAGATVATAFALSAQSTAESIEDDRDAGRPLTHDDIVRHNDAIDRRDAWRSGAAWMFGGGVAAALAVIYLVVTDDPPPVTEAATVALVPGGATASYAWGF